MAGERRGVGGGTAEVGGGGRGRTLAGSSPPCRVPRKGIDVHTRARLRGPGLSHPLGAFNKSIQATRGPHTCGHNHRRMSEGGSVRGMTHGGNHCSIPDHPIKTDREAERKEGGKDIYSESEVLTEKSSGTGKSKTNPLHNLPL